MSGRRLKHWGWGYEDQAPSERELKEAAAGIRERFGFGGEPEMAVPLEEVELRAARLKAPGALGDLFTDDRYERVAHALGKAYRDVVRGFRGEFPNPPDLVAFPKDESEIEAVLSWSEAEGAAVVPFGGGTSVVGGVEARVGDRPVVCIDLRRLDRVLEVDPVSMAARIQAGATGPGLEEQLREHGLTLRHFPQSFEYSTLGGWIATRAGGHFATLYTHIDDLVESVRAITPRGTWESRRLPGSGAGPSPDRMLIGSEGILGVDRRGLGAGPPAPRVQVLVRSRVRRFRRRGAGRPRDLPVGPVSLQLPPARRAGGGDDRSRVGGEEPAGPRLRVRPPPGRSRMDLALEMAREHGGAPGEVAPGPRQVGADIGPSTVGRGTPSAPGAAPFSWRPTCATHLSPVGCSPRRSRRRSPGIASRSSTRRRWPRCGRRWPRSATRRPRGRARRGSAAASPTSTPTAPAPYFTVLAPAVRGGEVEQWDEIKAAAAEAVIEGGGTITHHHAVGRDHRPWYDRQRPAPFAAALRAAKAELDPGRHAQPRRPDRPLSRVAYTNALTAGLTGLPPYCGRAIRGSPCPIKRQGGPTMFDSFRKRARSVAAAGGRPPRSQWAAWRWPRSGSGGRRRRPRGRRSGKRMPPPRRPAVRAAKT